MVPVDDHAVSSVRELINKTKYHRDAGCANAVEHFFWLANIFFAFSASNQTDLETTHPKHQPPE